MPTPILTFDNHHHASHSPPLEQLHGRNVPYFESAARVDAIRMALQNAGLVHLRPTEQTIPLEEIQRTHAAPMLAYLQYTSAHAPELVRADFATYGLADMLTGDDLYYYEQTFPPRYVAQNTPQRGDFYIYDNTSPIGPGTWNAVHHSASVAYAGALAVCDGVSRVYALCRPPGHHAGRAFMGGYCYLNNAAIAANTLKALGKVAVLDIDYHHGNGTQDIFWDNPDVLVISIHAEPALEYPYYCGYADERGGASAEGLNINYPLPFGTDEAGYVATLTQALSKIRAYAPGALVISLGFDTYRGDPMAQFLLDMPSYTRIGAMIAGLNLPTLYVQEGGYAVGALGEMAVSFFEGVTGEQ